MNKHHGNHISISQTVKNLYKHSNNNSVTLKSLNSAKYDCRNRKKYIKKWKLISRRKVKKNVNKNKSNIRIMKI